MKLGGANIFISVAQIAHTLQSFVPGTLIIRWCPLHCELLGT